MSDVGEVWSQALAVGRGRIVGFDHTQSFGN